MGPSETNEALTPGREIIPVGDKETLASGRGYTSSVTASPCHLSPCGSVGPRI